MKRKLVSGRMVTEASESQNMTICSKCPEKWLFVDLETGDVWHIRKGVKENEYPYWRSVREVEARELGIVARKLLRPENRRYLSKKK